MWMSLCSIINDIKYAFLIKPLPFCMLAKPLSINLLWPCYLQVTPFSSAPTCHPQTFSFFVPECFGIRLYKEASCSMKQDYIFQVSILLCQRGSSINSGDLVRYWPDPARRTHWLGAGVAADWPFGPSLLKKRDSNWFYPLALKTQPFMCPDPCTLYTVQYRHE